MGLVVEKFAIVGQTKDTSSSGVLSIYRYTYIV